LVGRGRFWEIDLEIINFVESFLERFLRYFSHPSDWILSFGAILNWVNIARNHTTPVRTRTVSTWTAIHAHIITTGRRTDDVDPLLVLTGDFKVWNKPPARFPDISQMLISAEDGSLLLAAAFTGAHATPEGAIDFDQVGIGFRVRNCHIKRMARGKAAAADEGKIFFGFGNNFLSVVISKVRFGNATEEFLHPSPTIMPNLHRVTGFQCVPHGICPHTSLHCLASRSC